MVKPLLLFKKGTEVLRQQRLKGFYTGVLTEKLTKKSIKLCALCVNPCGLCGKKAS